MNNMNSVYFRIYFKFNTNNTISIFRERVFRPDERLLKVCHFTYLRLILLTRHIVWYHVGRRCIFNSNVCSGLVGSKIQRVLFGTKVIEII